MLRATILAALVWLAPVAAALAQGAPPATLVADRIDFDRGRLVASGNVEAFSDGRVLRASRITYLRDEDRLVVEGPLVLLDGPDRVVVAEFAALGADLRDSLLRGARIVLDRRLQIAATEAATDGTGRYTQLYQAVASSCEVCADRPVPLWQIRARRIVQDRQENQLYFEGARFEVAGVPVAWLPRLRLPGPGLERSSGFLAPRFSSDDLLGFGVTVPYFVALGPSADLTVAPFAATRDARALNLRWRQAFRAGTLEVVGAVARDEVRPDATRGYLFAEGAFRLPRDYRLEFDVETTSDDTYLLQYGITEKDRLDSRLAVSRVERDNRFLGEVVAFRTLRAGERSDTLPSRVATVTRAQRRDLWGGIGRWQLEAHGRERPVSRVPAGAAPGAARDVVRLSASAEWRRAWVQPSGLLFETFAEAHFDAFDVAQDPAFPDDLVLRTVPYLGASARLPLARTDADGTQHLLEPVIQAVLAPSGTEDVPIEDSLTPEFDEGNALDPSRFAGRDARELGNRLDVGVAYRRLSPGGLSWGAYVGRSIRDRDLGQFRTGTGLDSKATDWLVSVHAERAGGPGGAGALALLSRTLFDDQLNVSRSETILRWRTARANLDTRYTYLEADAAAGRPRDTSEWGLDAAYDLSAAWTGRAAWRYDFITNEASRAGLGLTWRSDCVTVALDAERRFTSNVALEPTTRFGLKVELAGFGADDRPRRGRPCGT